MQRAAEQGDAIRTTSPPDKTSLSTGFLAFHVAMREGTSWRNSNTPERLSARMKNSNASAAITEGDCSWNPHPSCSPAARNATRTAASSQKDTMMPTAKATPCLRIEARLSPAFAKPSTLRDNTGNTHGMRLSSSPPRSAKPMATPSESELCKATGFATALPVRGAETVAAATVPASGASTIAAGAPPICGFAVSTPATRVNAPTR